MKTVPRFLFSTAVLAAFLCAAAGLRGQSAHWDPPGGSLPVGEVSSLQLVFDDCTPDTTPVPPKVDGLTFENQGQSNNISIINGTFSRTVSVTFGVLLSKQQDVVIPAFSISTNKGSAQVAAAHFSPAGATVGSGISLGEAAAAKMTASSASVWAGEVFDLKYTIDVGEGYYPNWARGTFDWDPSPLVIEDWTQPEPYETQDSGVRKGLSYHTRAIAPSAGLITLNPTSQIVNLSVGVAGFGFFQQRQYQQFSVPGAAPAIVVRPLPPSPDGFEGAVGEFKISSKVVPTSVKVGDPITWTVELSGSGNWPAIRGLPSREAPADFQVVQPKPKRTQPTGKLFEGTLSEDVVLVPTGPGTFELPPMNFTYFDPKADAYKVIVAPGGSVTVDPAAPAATSGPSAPASVPTISLASLASETKAPELPASGLGDPLASTGSAPEPIAVNAVVLACAVPAALLILFWGVLAYRRARANDPLNPQRDAHRRAAASLLALRIAPSKARAPFLLAWQRDSALLWGITHAAPPADTLDDPEWSALWSEADRSLYSTDSLLPTDWVARADAALAKKILRPSSASRLFLPKNLFPFLALALAFAHGSRLAAADGASAYQSGDFAAAEKAWSAQVSADPLDWSARHNLSLALAQQDRWAEAAAQASAAFVQNPSDPATRWQMALACDKAGFIPEPLDVLNQPGPLGSLARLESPGGWQRTGAVAVATAAAALALLLLRAYGSLRRRWVAPAALAVLVAALLASAAAWVGYRAYGITSDARAVVVWRAGQLRSIPTEADVSQKTTTLPAGSTALADKEFLGWIRLSFPNGETGWVLRSEATYLWGAPAN